LLLLLLSLLFIVEKEKDTVDGKTVFAFDLIFLFQPHKLTWAIRSIKPVCIAGWRFGLMATALLAST